jgi:hypothetical protein
MEFDALSLQPVEVHVVATGHPGDEQRRREPPLTQVGDRQVEVRSSRRPARRPARARPALDAHHQVRPVLLGDDAAYLADTITTRHRT